MIIKLRHLLGLDSKQNKIERYSEIQKSLNEINDEIDYIAEEFTIKNENFKQLLKSKSLDDDIKNSIQERYGNFIQKHKQGLKKMFEDRKRLKKEYDLLLNDNEISKSIKEIEFFNDLKLKYKNKDIGLREYNLIIKAKTGKVKYSDIIVCDKEGKILLIQRDQHDQNGGKWGIPGGHVDVGEDFYQAAKRELFEETGINVDEIKEIGIYDKDNVEIHYFRVKLDEDKQVVIQDKEGQDYKWIDLFDLEKYEMPFNMKDNIFSVLNFEEIEKKIIKAVNLGILSKNLGIELLKTKEIKELYTKRGIIPPEGKGIHTKEFHDLATKLMQQGMSKDNAYATAMKQLGRDRAVKKEHWGNIEKSEKIKGGKGDNQSILSIAKKHNVSEEHIKKQIDMGLKIEMEHTDDKEKSKEIVFDHLMESPDYYTELKKMESEFEKAGSGVYVDNPKNRKLNRVGQKYGFDSKEEDKKEIKLKEGEEDKLSEQAKKASDEALNSAAKESNDENVRQAAKNELEERNKEKEKKEISIEGKKEDVEKLMNENSEKLKKLQNDSTQAIMDNDLDKFNELSNEISKLMKIQGELSQKEKYDKGEENRQKLLELGLNENEIDDLISYTGERYWDLNEELRKKDKLSNEIIKEVSNINNGLEKLPKFKGIVFRGIESDNLEKDLKNWINGNIVTFNSFTSTSKNKETAESFGDLQFEINSKNGRDIAFVSQYGEGEEEILFKSNTKFKIDKVKTVRSGDLLKKLTIILTEL